jgi:hypothetical protein
MEVLIMAMMMMMMMTTLFCKKGTTECSGKWHRAPFCKTRGMCPKFSEEYAASIIITYLVPLFCKKGDNSV